MKFYKTEDASHLLMETQDNNELIAIGKASELTQGPGGFRIEKHGLWRMPYGDPK